MSNTITQESEIVSKVPETYKSGFSFLLPTAQKDFATMNYDEIKFLFLAKPKEKARYVYELWKTGRLSVVYEYFTDREKIMRDSMIITAPDGEYSTDELTVDDIAFNTAILLKEGVSSEESISFVDDLLRVCSNAHDGQNFGEESLDPDSIAGVTDMVWTLASKYYKGIEGL